MRYTSYVTIERILQRDEDCSGKEFFLIMKFLKNKVQLGAV